MCRNPHLSCLVIGIGLIDCFRRIAVLQFEPAFGMIENLKMLFCAYFKYLCIGISVQIEVFLLITAVFPLMLEKLLREIIPIRDL